MLHVVDGVVEQLGDMVGVHRVDDGAAPALAGHKRSAVQARLKDCGRSAPRRGDPGSRRTRDVDVGFPPDPRAAMPDP